MELQKETNAQKWEKVELFFKSRFTEAGETPDLDTILFLIGVQELGKGKLRFKKDDKLNLLHIAVCRILEPYGYYRFEGTDNDGWPHFELIENLPELKTNEQSILMKNAIIQYFEDQSLFEQL